MVSPYLLHTSHLHQRNLLITIRNYIFIMVSLPTKAIDEIISLASNCHNKLTSPTGVADVFDFANADDISPTTQNKVAGSSVECLEYATASSSTSPQSSAPSLTALRHFPNEQIAHQGINECSTLHAPCTQQDSNHCGI